MTTRPPHDRAPEEQLSAKKPQRKPPAPAKPANDNPTIPHGPSAAVDTGITLGNVNAYAGQTFGDFALVQEVGRGGMGVVYKAKQKSLDRLVAFKILRPEHANNPVVLTRFLTESRAAAALQHPHIVKVFQVGKCDIGHFFVMEYIDGYLLETLIQQRPIPMTWAVSLMILVAEAVHYAHSQKVLHRDLKPANIMIDRHTRRPVVMDFGIAKFMGESSQLTQPGVVMGTPAFMPPEQAGEEYSLVGPHSDVYSLGAILYTLLTGKLPFEGDTALRTILKVIAQDAPLPVRKIRPDVPANLEEICMKCLQKKPSDRYRSARDLARDLRTFHTSNTSQSNNIGAVTQRGSLSSVFLVDLVDGKQMRFFEGTTSVVGRGSVCDVVLDDPQISRRHCQIHVQKNQVIVEDLGSDTGTFVNGRKVERCRLQDGDHLTIAGHKFQIRIPK